MHSDERVELKNSFCGLMEETDWNKYITKEDKTKKYIYRSYRIFLLLFMLTTLALGFLAMHGYIDKYYQYIAVGLAVVYLFLERINLEKISNFLLRKKRKNIMNALKDNVQFVEKLQIFEKIDVLPENYVSSMNFNDEVVFIAQVKNIYYYLQYVRSLEETQREIKEKTYEIE